MLHVNADDLGWNEKITDRILDCHRKGRISSVSAMTFMKDSERAAGLARENGLLAGLHLNFTQEFTDGTATKKLKERHQKVAGYLNAHKVSQVLFNPFLYKEFEYVFQCQWDEFCRLYEEEPARLDGHHHMHLCMNMLILNKYPRGLKIRRNFTFSLGEKGPVNRLYRYLIDRWLTSRFQTTDYFFSLKPVEPEKIRRIVMLSKSADVELMVHPGLDEECNYLLSEDWVRLIFSVRLQGEG